ncbi:glutathione S-transferase [Apiospora aurea]|uniref:Glutathione S-transferase n=1 Tax=Apiospora aurea TaxID=335848 RepID=A0ABR1PSQ9_9PEZI
MATPRYFAPPLFKHGDLVISQTPNILLYLGPKLGLAGLQEDDVYRVNALALTALDRLSDEVHDSHHSIAVMLPYEDQKEESRRRSQYWIQNRLPSHLDYWQKVVESDKASPGPWLLGGIFTYADLVLFQLWEDVKTRPNLAAYLASDRRQTYQDWGIYRHYPDNDVFSE